MNQMAERDYTFRFRIDPPDAGEAAGREPSTEMVRKLLENLLDIVVPCVGDGEVKIDGFKLLNNRSLIHKLFEDRSSPPAAERETPSETQAGGPWYQNIKNVGLYEPRIELIKRQLENLLALVSLEKAGQPVEVDGFSLKDPGQWTVPSACDPGEIFEYAGSRCNCDCVFCYLKGRSPDLALEFPVRPTGEEFDEIRTRLAYFSPGKQRSLFPALGSTCEVLTHPKIAEILTDLRPKTETVFRIITNGSALTPEMIETLAGLQPVYLDVSLNSSSPARRQRLMRDRNPEVAISALHRLKEARIPYSIVIVPWPLDSAEEMLADLESTAAYAAENDAHLIQVSLPGYTRFFSDQQVFDRDSLWAAILQKVQEIRPRLGSPVVVMPGAFEEYLCRPQKNVPEVIGVVKNSPAALCGARQGDIIRSLGGFSVRNRPQVRDLLSMFQKSGVKELDLTVLRDGLDHRLKLDLGSGSYPSSRLTDTHLGFIFMGTGLRAGYLERLKQIINAHGAKKVLFLSSVLVRPMLEQLLAESYLFSGAKIDIAVPNNRSLGGNIFMGDLLLVEDFIAEINEYVKTHEQPPDLVIIPSSPFNMSGWGRDLSGRCYLDIERSAGIPVELLECQNIYD